VREYDTIVPVARKHLLIPLAISSILAAQQASQWVYFGPDGKLQYRADERGNRIMDFSHAGYRGGGVRLPSPPASKTLKPVEGDNTPQIQTALDAAGVIQLSPGTYDLAGALSISKSNTVLRGAKGAVIRLTGKPHRFLSIRGSGTWQTGERSAGITDSYVPSGADSFTIPDSSVFKAGDTVLVRRPVTDSWIHFMGMDTLVRDGKQQTWIKGGTFIRADRTIKSIERKKVTLDVPLSDSIDAKYLNPPGASLVEYTFPGRITEVGVESLRIDAPGIDVPITEGQYTAVQIDAALDAWVRDLEIHDTQNTITIGPAAKRVTLDNVRVLHGGSHTGAAAPADFALSGTQILLNKCAVRGEGVWPVVTQATVTGPNVILEFTSDARGVAPHQRWATGLLVDRSRFDNATAQHQGIAFSNRKTAGSGHGWDIGWAVAWNVTTPFFLIQNPPGAINWCIGCKGQEVDTPPAGTWDARNQTVTPSSLYLEQLRQRLGDAAVKAIGY
jgi:hypothetical protein